MLEGAASDLELWSSEDVLQQLGASLDALRTDYVDLYQFHSGTRAAFDDAELWSALAEQVRAGRIRHLGISISASTDDYQKRATRGRSGPRRSRWSTTTGPQARAPLLHGEPAVRPRRARPRAVR